MRTLIIDPSEKEGYDLNIKNEEEIINFINDIHDKEKTPYQGELSLFDVLQVFPGFELTEVAVKKLKYDVVCIEGEVYTEKRGEDGNNVTPTLRKLTDNIYCFYHPIGSDEVLFQATGFITWVDGYTLKKIRQYITIIHTDETDTQMKDISSSALNERILERAHVSYPYSRGQVTHDRNDWCYPSVHTGFSDVVVNVDKNPRSTTAFVVYPTVGVKLEITELKKGDETSTDPRMWSHRFVWVNHTETTFTHLGKDYEISTDSFVGGVSVSAFIPLAKREIDNLGKEC